jgi:subfamily B ATP-binding cassette protein MsbA
VSRSESAGTAGVQESWQLYRRLMRYAWPYRWMFALAAVGMVLLSATAGGFAAVMKPLVDEGFVNRDPGMMRIIPLVIVGLFILRGLATVMAEYTTTWISRRVIFDVRNSVFRHLVRLPSAYYERQSSGGLVAKLIFDLEQIAAAVTQAVFTIVSDGLTAVALLAWLFYVNWRLTLILIVLLPLSTFLLRLMSKRFRKTSEQIQLTMGEISRVAQEAAEGQRVVKAYRGQDTEMRAFLTANERNRKQVMRRPAVDRCPRARGGHVYRARGRQEHGRGLRFIPYRRDLANGPDAPPRQDQRSHSDRTRGSPERVRAAG